MAELFAGKEWQTFLQILPTIPFETWETVWSTVVATLMALVIGLPLGVLLVAGERDGVLPLPRWLMSVLNVLINLGGVKDEAKAAFFSEEGKKLVARADEIAQRIQDTVNHDIMG